jgi:UDP-N-acetylmuramate--alanine ligase
VFRDRRNQTETRMAGLRLPMPGEHNISNAVAAIAVARELGVSEQAIKRALERFGGVKRRFTRVGEWHGSAIIDDYGHHPVEITAVLKAARQAYSGPIVAIIQPHRYTRLRDLFEQFCTCLNSADAAIVAPVYPAGEAAIAGADRDALAEGMRAHGHKQVLTISGPEDLPGVIAPLVQPKGAVICLGAGSITYWAAGLQSALEQYEASS